MLGNSVLLKHSPRTPLCGEHYESTFKAAGFPEGVLQASFADHHTAAEIINRPEISFVSFTGSVNGCVNSTFYAAYLAYDFVLMTIVNVVAVKCNRLLLVALSM